MSDDEFDDEFKEIDFSQPALPQFYEQDCPLCKQKVRFINDSRRQGYWRDYAEHYKKLLALATEHLKKIDEWCMQNINDTYTASKWRELLDKIRDQMP